MFSHGAHRLHRFDEIHRLAHAGDPVVAWVRDFDRRGARMRHRLRRGRRGPSVVTLLLAGLAVFALMKLSTVASASRRRTLAEKVLLGTLIVMVGAVVLSFHRSAQRRRHRW